jgi:hypothetical protein
MGLSDGSPKGGARGEAEGGFLDPLWRHHPMRFHLSTAALGAALVFAVTVPVGAQGTSGSPGHMTKKPMMAAAGPHQVTVALKALNGSGESGKAVLKDTKKGVSVVLTLTGGAAGVDQPAHIHKGTCAKLDPKPEYPLTNVVGGSSKTTVAGVTVAQLMASPNAINVHKSATEIPTYVACGDIASKRTKM